ncbi:MAG: cell division protein FtsQ/DivIB [Clostridiales bacterium]|nr:cell division protein FtsQ/DivIB [Clostridiales bacterium]
MRKKRRKERRRRVLRIALPVLILVAVLAVIMVWKVFVVKEVEVVGNEIYSDEQIESWALDDEYSWNSLYVLLKNKFQKQEEIPFVDTIDISLLSPSKIQIEVTEKGVLGYVYISTLGQNAYFDQDGFVVELSSDVIDGTMKISGLSVENAELYEKLDLEDSSILKTLLSLTQLLKKYDCVPELIYVNDGDILLSYGSIQVNIGTGSSLNEKILRMDQILTQLDESQSGTLHLDTWSQSSTDIYFKQGELTDIPVDEQTLPVEDDTDEEEAAETEDPDGDGESVENASEAADAENGTADNDSGE